MQLTGQCRQEQLDVSFGERERKIHRDPAGNRTRDLPITSRTLLTTELLDPQQRSRRVATTSAGDLHLKTRQCIQW